MGDVTRHKVEHEEQERERVSKGKKHVAAEQTDGQEEEEYHYRQKTVQHCLVHVLRVARVRSSVLATRRHIALPKNLVPREVQREYWREQAEAHDEATVAAHESTAEQATSSIASIIGLWVRALPLRSIWYVSRLPRVLIRFLREDGYEFFFGDAALADGAHQRVPRLL